MDLPGRIWALCLAYFVSVGLVLVGITACSVKKESAPPSKMLVEDTTSDSECDSCADIKTKWVEAGYTDAEVTKLSADSAAEKSPSYTVNLQVVVVKGSGWTEALLRQRYQIVANIFNQCALKINIFKVEVSAPLNEAPVDHGDVNRPSTQNFAENFPTFEKTVFMIHVKELIESTQAISGPELRLGAESKLTHKNWMAFTATTSPAPAGWVAEAHELGHDLFNMDHVPYHNLVGLGFKGFSTKVTEEQCQSLAIHPQVIKN